MIKHSFIFSVSWTNEKENVERGKQSWKQNYSDISITSTQLSSIHPETILEKPSSSDMIVSNRGDFSKMVSESIYTALENLTSFLLRSMRFQPSQQSIEEHRSLKLWGTKYIVLEFPREAGCFYSVDSCIYFFALQCDQLLIRHSVCGRNLGKYQFVTKASYSISEKYHKNVTTNITTKTRSTQ